MKRNSEPGISDGTVVLHPSRLRRTGQLLIPLAALLLLGLTAYFLITAEEPSLRTVRDLVWRMFCCAVIFGVSLFYRISGRITFLLTPEKIRRKGGRELPYGEIASVTLKKSAFGSRLELVPKTSPDAVFCISSFLCDRPLDEVAGILRERCENNDPR